MPKSTYTHTYGAGETVLEGERGKTDERYVDLQGDS